MPDKARWWPPASHLHPLLTPCDSKTTEDETFDSNCAHFSKYEICLHLVYRSAGSDCFSGFLRRNVAKTSAADISSATDLLCGLLTPILLPSEMYDSTLISSPSPHSRHAHITTCPAKVELGFCLMGHAPKLSPLSPLRPKSIRCNPCPLSNMLRSDPIKKLSSYLQWMSRFSCLSG